MQEIALELALLGFAGIAAQWLAWRLHLPAIALLLVAGLVAGPGLGWLDPARDFGEVYRPVVSLAVALILFEGGLTLNFAEIRETSMAVRRIIVIGGPLVWALATLAAHYAGGLSWPVATVLGAILVVTGPTVIMPLLRQARMKNRPSALLRWEAIINDPIGALFAVIAFETILVSSDIHGAGHVLTGAVIAAVMALPGGWALAKAIVWLFVRGHVPEYLKTPFIVALVLVAYALTNLALDEAGLLTVTVMGVTLANSRIAILAEMRRFKEMITVLLVSAVFILLSASLKVETIAEIGIQAMLFVALILFVVRPVAIFVATIGTALSWQERLMTAWIAPRGIVAVAISGLFGSSLAAIGVADGSKLLAFTFAVVAATIILHGFSLPLLARLLDLRSSEHPGLLIVGASAWTAGLAARLKEFDIPVTIADSSWTRLRHARTASIPVYFGDPLSERAHHDLDLKIYQGLIAATDNDAYNALVCTDFGPEIGRSRVFQIGRESASGAGELRFTLGGRPLLEPCAELGELEMKRAGGWTFTSTQITKEFTWKDYIDGRPAGTVPILWINPSRQLRFVASRASATPSPGSHVIAFGPRPEREAAREARAEQAADEVRQDKTGR